MWIPVSEGCGAWTLPFAVYIAGCGIATGSLNHLSRHFSAELESSFECNGSEIRMERHRRTRCNTDNNSVEVQVSHSFFI